MCRAYVALTIFHGFSLCSIHFPLGFAKETSSPVARCPRATASSAPWAPKSWLFGLGWSWETAGGTQHEATVGGWTTNLRKIWVAPGPKIGFIYRLSKFLGEHFLKYLKMPPLRMSLGKDADLGFKYGHFRYQFVRFLGGRDDDDDRQLWHQPKVKFGAGRVLVVWKVPLRNNPFHKGIPGIQATNPNDQFIISWCETEKNNQTCLLYAGCKICASNHFSDGCWVLHCQFV